MATMVKHSKIEKKVDSSPLHDHIWFSIEGDCKENTNLFSESSSHAKTTDCSN